MLADTPYPIDDEQLNFEFIYLNNTSFKRAATIESISNFLYMPQSILQMHYS